MHCSRCCQPKGWQSWTHLREPIAPPPRREPRAGGVPGDHQALIAIRYLDGNRLSRAVIAGAHFVAERGEDVQYRFHNVPPGLYSLTVKADGYEDSRPKTVRVADRPLRLKIDLLEVHVLMGAIAAPEKK